MDSTDHKREVDRLAGLSRIEYERERKDAANKLGVRMSVLDDEVQQRRPNPTDKQAGKLQGLEPTEPWPEVVDGVQLLADIVSVLSRFMVLSREQAVAVALWIIFAHAHDAAEHSPILAFQSPEKRCGKTTLLEIVTRLVPDALPAGNITAAAIFRTIEALRPTLLLDEADTFLPNSEEMRGVVNNGFSRDSAFVIRLVGEDHEPMRFTTWCPKVIALIGNLPDTIEDRAISIRLRRKLSSETTERFGKRHHQELDAIRARCARWAADNVHALHDGDPEMPFELDDRRQDCWRPLFAIVDLVAGEWPQKARHAALQLTGNQIADRSTSAGVLLLEHARHVFGEKGVTTLTSTELQEALKADEHWPWGEWRGGTAISTRGIAKLLKPYGIQSRKGRRANEYHRSDFEEAWDRYLDPVIAPDTPAVSSTTSTGNAKVNENRILDANGGASTSSTSGEDVEDQKSPQTPVDTSFVEHVEHEAGVRPNGHAHVDDTDIVEVWI